MCLTVKIQIQTRFSINDGHGVGCLTKYVRILSEKKKNDATI